MNNQENQKNNLEKDLFEKIQNGDIKMKPRAYFMLKTVLFIIAVLILFLFIIYLTSFIIFTLFTSGVWFLPNFGFHGIGILIGSLPWLLIILSIGLVIVLEIFAERLEFVYHRPVVYSLIFIVITILLTSFLINLTPFHSNIFKSSYDRHLPIIGSFYRDYGSSLIHNVHNGIVLKLTDNGFIMEKPNGELLTVIINSKNLISPEVVIEEGDTLVVIGERTENAIEASAIHKIQEDEDLFPSHRLRIQPFIK